MSNFFLNVDLKKYSFVVSIKCIYFLVENEVLCLLELCVKEIIFEYSISTSLRCFESRQLLSINWIVN